jgi:hypothetical protein
MRTFQINPTALESLASTIGTAPTADLQRGRIEREILSPLSRGFHQPRVKLLDGDLVAVELLGEGDTPGPVVLMYAPTGSTLLAALEALESE